MIECMIVTNQAGGTKLTESTIWVVIYAKPYNGSLRPLLNERTNVGADMMYPRRFAQSKAMKNGDRIAVHFGGPRGSDALAQHLVQAGYVKETARPLNQEDIRRYSLLTELTKAAFPFFQMDPSLLARQGIIFYQLFEPTEQVGPLPRPYLPPKVGDNFIKLIPGDPVYHQVNNWWCNVVLKKESSVV